MNEALPICKLNSFKMNEIKVQKGFENEIY